MSKSRGNMSKNPLLGASGTFSLDSPALLVPAATAPNTLSSRSNNYSPGAPPSNANSIASSGLDVGEISNSFTNPGTGGISNLFTPSSSNSVDPFANVGLNSIPPTDGFQTAFDNGSTLGIAGSESSHQSVKSISPCSSNAAIYGGSPFPSVSSINPPSSVFLLPSSTTNTSSSIQPAPYTNNPSVLTSPPTFTIGEGISSNKGNAGGINLRKSRYVAPPGINSINSLPPSICASTMPMSPSTSNLPTLVPDATTSNVNASIPIHWSSSTPDFSQGMHVPPPHREPDSDMKHFPQQVQNTPPYIPDLVYHWFYLSANCDSVPSYLETQPYSQNSSQTNSKPASKYKQEVWKPFSMIDSVAIEDAFVSEHHKSDAELIPTDGGRYDVNIGERVKTAVYWPEAEPTPIRRCSWFYHSNVDGRWIPYEEQLAARLEEEYRSANETGQWGTKLEIAGGEYITLHSASVMMHFPTATPSTLDDWGQVQPPQDPMLKPRIVHRGLEGLPEIPDGENPGEVDHLIFVIHGIGSACDMKLRSIVGVTDGLRELTADMSERHFSFAHLSNKASRVEFLPVNWHKTLHGEDEGTDSRLKPMTLRSIPKLRGFVNDTILDVLFYTSPVYCQKILNTVTSEINRMYTLFMARNENFKGEVSFIGHSLGSLIMFDILCNQTEKVDTIDSREVSDGNTEVICGSDNPGGLDINISEVSVEQLFVNLGIEGGLATPFVREGIDVEALMTCGDEDLKEGGLPLGPRKRLLAFIESRKTANSTGGIGISGLEAFIKASSIEDIKYTVGPAGTGQPSVKYPQLMFEVSSFYALGSPIGMFMAVRGIDTLGTDFKLPTCERFYNIFHPFDPVAYRMEALIKKEYGLSLKPVTIPHHKGRKRMHLELRDTVTKLMTSDFKQKVIDSVSAAIGTFYNMATGTQQTSDEQMVEQMVQQEISKKDRESPDSEERNPTKMDSRLNQGNRIDFVLQEAPFESFNEYVFALGSHLCYWESEDTCLLILKDIYTEMGVHDDQSHSVQGIKSPSPSITEFPRPPTAILAPPPTPLGGPMVGPPVPVNYNSTPTAILAPPPTPLGGPMLGPSVPVVKSDKTSKVDDSQAPRLGLIPTQGPLLPPLPTVTPSQTSANIAPPGPPPPMMNVTTTAFSSGPPLSRGYPKPTSYPSTNTENKIGMDPTVPVGMKSVPIGPPPAGGFVMRK